MAMQMLKSLESEYVMEPLQHRTAAPALPCAVAATNAIIAILVGTLGIIFCANVVVYNR